MKVNFVLLETSGNRKNKNHGFGQTTFKTHTFICSFVAFYFHR